MKKIAILGSTGSIGTQAIDIIKDYPQEFKVVALTGNHNIKLLLDQATWIRPQYVVIFNEENYKQYKNDFERLGITLLSGLKGILDLVVLDHVDVVINALVGNVGLLPTLHAIRAKKHVAIANKECLVTAGEILMAEARDHGASLVPIDSEHSAILQCLRGNQLKDIKRVILTASGGPFRDMDRAYIASARASQALKHPNWSMGQKISIDSATLMNKGLEVIEAKWLYDLDPSQIDVVVHKESVIHSMVEFVDHSTMAQMGEPTMKVPILYALSYPDRKPTNLAPLDLIKYGQLTFQEPRRDDFPCLDLAYESMKQGGMAPTVMNAANEVLVYKYLKDQIGFYDIPKVIEKAMTHFSGIACESIEAIIKVDADTRAYVESIIRS